MTEMTVYEWQRFVFRKAVKNGWPGKEPSVLGGDIANSDFDKAEKFLIEKGLLGRVVAVPSGEIIEEWDETLEDKMHQGGTQ